MKEIIDELKKLIKPVEKFKQHNILLNKESYISEVWQNGYQYGVNETVEKVIKILEEKKNDIN